MIMEYIENEELKLYLMETSYEKMLKNIEYIYNYYGMKKIYNIVLLEDKDIFRLIMSYEIIELDERIKYPLSIKEYKHNSEGVNKIRRLLLSILLNTDYPLIDENERKKLLYLDLKYDIEEIVNDEYKNDYYYDSYDEDEIEYFIDYKLSFNEVF